MSEDGAARYQNLSARADDVSHGIKGNSAINLNSKIKPALLAHSGKLANLIERTRDEFLSAEAWIDRHHQHQIHHVKHLGEGLDRSRGINHYSRFAAMIGDVLQRPVQMNADLLVDGNPVCSCIGKLRHVAIRL